MASILVVDDEPLIRQLLVEVLQEVSGEVEEAADGVDALAKTGARDYDLVITDLLMPRMNGFAFIEKLREARSPVPVVVISGSIQLDADDKLKPHGVYATLRKPVDLMDLISTVKRALRFGKLQAAAATA